MRLPIPFLNTKKEDTEYYLSLLLTDEKAGAVILHESLGKIKIVSKHEEFFSTSIEDLPLEELIDVVDRTISRAEEVLPPDIETHKTVFGVKENWVEEETKKIKKDYLSHLKKLCDALDLSPIGFMVISEAITHLLQEEEGAPLSAILAEVGKSTVSLTLLRGGKKIESVSGQLKEFSPPVTVDTLLRHFTIPVLPARIILFDSDSTERHAQQFIAHQWSKSLPFLHVPQITTLPAGFDARAVTFGAASQMGFEVLDTHIVKPKTHQASEIPEAEPSEESPPTEPEEEIIESAENFGFVIDQDIATVKPHPSPAHALHKPKHPTPEPQTHHETAIAEHEDVKINIHEPDDEDPQEQEEGKSFLSALPSIKLPRLALPSFSSFGGNRFLLPLIGIAILVIAILSLYAFYVFKVHATIELTVKPNMVNQTSPVVFSATSPSDFSQNTIAAKTLTATVDGEITTPTTGKKDVGDKAKGTVTIYNNDNAKTTLSSGTEIKSTNGLIFVLDKDIAIASASGDIFSGTKPGTTDVNVTAKEIGTDSNLPSGSRFAIGSNATLAAKNDKAFSGGTKKSITVVSKNDIAKLKEDLPKTLQDRGKDAIFQKAAGDETVLPFYNNTGLEKTSFDKGVDDEAKQIKLKASVVFSGLSYKNSDLTDYAKSILKSHYSQDISFADNSVKASAKDTKQKDENDVGATVQIEAGLLPKINTEEVAQKIAHKSLKEARDTLAGIPQIATNEITFSPNIPLLPNLLPQLPNNVSVVVKSN